MPPRSDIPADPAPQLAVLTDRYARFGQLGDGLGAIPMAVLLLATAVAAWSGSRPWTALLAALAPPVGVIGAAIARGWYQRHGRVVAQLEPNLARPTPSELMAWAGRISIWSWIVCSGAAGVIAVMAVWFRAADVEVAPLAIPFASAVVTAALLRASHPRRGEFFVGAIGTTGMIVYVLSFMLTLPSDSLWIVYGYGTLLGSLGSLYVGIGLWRHLLYLRLQRELAGRKDPA